MPAPILTRMERTRNGLIPFVVPALLVVSLAGLAILFFTVRWFNSDAHSSLRQRVTDAAASVERDLDAAVQRQSDATRALGTSPMVWLWVKFQGERLSPSNRSHAQWALDEVSNYSGLLPGATVYLASERTRTVYQGGAAVAALVGNDARDSWYAASLGTEGVLVSDDTRSVRTSMRVMNGQTLLGAISCVSDLASVATGAFSAAAAEPGFSFVLADKAGAVLMARGEASASATTVFDMFSPAERANIRAAMAAVTRPGAMSVEMFPAKGRRLLTAVTRTAAPGWYLFVSADVPRVPATRVVIAAGITAAALALLAAALVIVGLARARRNESLVRRLEGEREAAAGLVREVAAAALRLRSAAGTLRERTASLAAEAADGKAAGAEAAGLLGRAEESAAEVRSGIAARLPLLDELAATARDAAGKSREARTASETAGSSAAAAEEELNRVITTGSALAAVVENAARGVDAVVEAAERTRLLALNAALEASRSGGQGARVADEMRKLAEETSTRVQELSGALGEARSSVHRVSRAAQDAGKAVREAADRAAESARGLEMTWQSADGVLSRLESATAHASRLRNEADLSDRGRSAVEGVSRIMTRIEALCTEIAALAAAVAADSAQAAQKSSTSLPQPLQGKAVS